MLPDEAEVPFYSERKEQLKVQYGHTDDSTVETIAATNSLATQGMISELSRRYIYSREKFTYFELNYSFGNNPILQKLSCDRLAAVSVLLLPKRELSLVS